MLNLDAGWEEPSMARMNHPNLLGVIDFGGADGMPLLSWNMCMEVPAPR